ncbi:MAG: dihydropteroate synthase [Chlorobi bacterium]|nr:dihydropteroate synthase [Chlorobiota bacterium]
MNNKNTFLESNFTINCNGKLIDLNKPVVMGILNITPDSFYDGGKYKNEKAVLSQIEKMICEGAEIIDIGAYSSRPGAKEISEGEEKKRLKEVLHSIKHEFNDIVISVDTFRAEIAKMAFYEFGVDIINDISAGELDAKMFPVISEINIPYIMMHMAGNPGNMQNNPQYKDVVQELVYFFSVKINQLHNLGVKDIIIDPGFGFGKTIGHNYELLKKLQNFKILNLPILVGISRKSFIYKLLDISAKEALNGSTVWHTVALLNGANILRTHDVKEAMEAIKIVDMLKSGK